jgi:hypothetical protein
LPGAEVILSTWEGYDVSSLGCDVLMENKDPGFLYWPNGGVNNVNRQIVSTLAGLKASTRKYALKLRTDCILSGNQFLKFFDLFPRSEQDYKVFSHKVISCCYFTRNPKAKLWDHYYSYHLSDIAHFGLAKDLVSLFDIPLMPKGEEFYWINRGVHYSRYVPEQYIFINFLRKIGKKVDYDNYGQTNSRVIEETERYFASNVILLDWELFTLIPPRHFSKYGIDCFTTCITHIEWQRLYQKYVDSSLVLAKEDKVRRKLELMHKIYKICQVIARLAVLPLFGKSRKRLRQKLRTRIVDYLQKYFW